MDTDGNEAPQPDAPLQLPADFAATTAAPLQPLVDYGQQFYPPTYLQHYPQTQNPSPYDATVSFYTPPENPYVAPYTYPYGYPAPAPPTYQDPMQNVALYGSLNPSTYEIATGAGVYYTANAYPKAPNKLKTAHSFCCDVCKVDCNSKSILDQHKLGKKHKNNLKKLVAANSGAILPALTVPGPAGSGSQLIGPQEKPVKGRKSEDLGTKTSKLVKEGVAADSVRVCAICNVVCNSDTVLRSHLAGQKHIKEAKKRARS